MHCSFAEFPGVLLDSGQAGPEVAANRKVVVADDADILRHAQAVLADGAHRADRHAAVVAKMAVGLSSRWSNALAAL